MEQAVIAHPRSAALQCAFGDLIARSEGELYKSAEALAAYERAVQLDPDCADAYEGIGYYWDVYGDNYERAEAAFRNAIECGAGADSYAGLARVLAERGNAIDTILSFLDASPCAGEARIQEVRTEIARGAWAPIRLG